MSLLLCQPPKLCLQRSVFVRASRRPVCHGFSSDLLQTPPCLIISADQCGANLGKLIIFDHHEGRVIHMDKKVPLEVLDNAFSNEIVTIGSSYGWVATLKDDEILRLQDDLNPVASDSNPKRIPLPPLVTLPHCQTQIVTNVSMSSPSPEDEDCVVAVKFLGPQLSFCRPGQSNPEWINIRIQNPCFFSSRVMFSKKHDMFCIPGSGGHLIGSWDLRNHKHRPKLQKLQYQNLPELTKTMITRENLSKFHHPLQTKRELLHSCCTSEHLVESQSTGETFLVKWYRKTAEIINGVALMQTEALMVFKLDEEGNAVYTDDIGDLCIFLSKSEPFCVPTSGLKRNVVHIIDFDEVGRVYLRDSDYIGTINGDGFRAPYHIPPLKIG